MATLDPDLLVKLQALSFVVLVVGGLGFLVPTLLANRLQLTVLLIQVPTALLALVGVAGLAVTAFLLSDRADVDA